MSKTTDNVITKNYHGKFGNQVVLRTQNGKSILAKLPKKSDKEPSAAQLEVRRNFRSAINYAKAAMADPVLKAMYESHAGNGLAAHVIALTDYLKSPKIDRIDVLEYRGKVGDRIIVSASDDFQVSKVKMRIFAADETIIEEGPCIQDPIRGEWIYTATVEVDALADMKLVAIAYDNPDHTGQSSLSL
jgi:hypothetical protein